MRYCTKCGAPNDELGVAGPGGGPGVGAQCVNCHEPLSPVAGYQPMQSVNQGVSGSMIDYKSMGADKKVVAGIVAILLGAFGVHKFLLGYTNEGIIMLAITVVSCGIFAIVPSVIGIIEGIMYLTKSDEEFVRTYIQSKKGWF